MSTVFDAHREAFAGDPNDRRAFESLEEHYFLEGAWSELAALYRERVEASSVVADLTLQSPLLFRLGQILEERTLDIEGATEVYWRLAKLDPQNRPALRQLRGIYERREQWDMVLQIAEIEGQAKMPSYDRAAFESELGAYWKEHLQDAEESRRAYERALVADPLCPEALEGLAQLHIEAERFAEAAELLEILAGRLRGPERAPVWTALGKLYAHSLGERQRAAACFESALEDDPFMMSAVEWSLLIETEFENWTTVSDLLERRFDLAAGARHRAAIAVEASQLQLSQLESPAAARAWINRACELAADEPTVLLARADVDRAENNTDALLETLEELREALGTKMPRALLLEAAQLHARNDNSDLALQLMRLASEKPGSNDVAYLSLQADLFRDSGSKRELAEVLETLSTLDTHQGNPKRVAYYVELAQIQEDDFSDEESARATWQRAFELDPKSHISLEALDRLHRKFGDTRALQETLERALEAQGQDADLDLRVRLAQLQLDSETSLGAAQRHFELVLDSQPHHRAALGGLRTLAERQNNSDLLLSVCEREMADCKDSDDIARLAATCLPLLEQDQRFEAALEWADRWNEAVPNTAEALRWKANMEERLERSPAELESRRALARLESGRERAQTLRRQAALLQASGDSAGCINALEESLREEPNDLDCLNEIAALHRSAEHFEPLAEVLRRLAEALPNHEQAPVLEELAQLLHDPLGDLDAAIAVRRRLMDLPNASEESAIAFETLLEAVGRHAELNDLFEARRASLADDAPGAMSLDLRRSELLIDQLGQSETAAEILESLFNRHPENTRVVELLEQALRAGNNSRGLCDLLERREQRETDPVRRSALLFERAGLLEQDLGEPLAACNLYEELAREERDAGLPPMAQARLEVLLEAEGLWSRLRDLLIDRLASSEATEQNILRERIAQISRARLGDAAGCAEHLEAIAENDPVELRIWQQLEDLYRNDLDRPADWLRVIHREIEAGTAEARELTLQITAARLLADDDRRPASRVASEAIGHFERVLELDPSHEEAAHALAEHYKTTHQPEQTRRILETRLAQLSRGDTEEAEEASGLRVQLGHLLADEIGDHEAAIAHFETVHAQGQVIPAIAESLATLYEQNDRFEPLVSLSWRMIEAQGPAEESALWRLRHARSARTTGDLNLAAASYRVALEINPADHEIESELIELYEEQNDFQPLAHLLERRITSLPTDESIPVRLRLAKVLAEKLEQPSAGLEQLEAVLTAHPDHREAFDQALDLADQTDDSARLRTLLDRGLSLATSDAERAGFLERRARLFADYFEDSESALTDLREATGLVPDRRETRQLLRQQLERLERWPAVLDCLYLELGQAEGSDRAEICEQAARIAEDFVSANTALPWLTRLHKERPDDAQVLARIGAIHRTAGRSDATLRALDEEITLRTEASERIDLQIQRAELLEHSLESPGRAALAYQAALEEQPKLEIENRILTELDRLYAALDRPTERARVLEMRADRAEGPEAVTHRSALASLYSDCLGQAELAMGPLLQNIDALRGDPVAEMAQLKALEEALRGRGQTEAWTRAAERSLELMDSSEEVRSATSDQDRASLQIQLARAYDEELGQPVRAIEHLRAISDGQIGLDEHTTRLLQLLRKTGRSAELARHLVQHLESGRGSGAQWLELAQLREERLHDLTGALEAYRQASSDPEIILDAIRGQRRCAERLRDWEMMADALRLEMEQTDGLSPFERAAAARKSGQIYWERLGSSELAIEAFETALALEPENIESIRALTRIREASNDPSEASTLYRRELDLLGSHPTDLARAREIWLRIATSLTGVPEREREILEALQSAAKIEQLTPVDELRVARLHDELGESDLFCKSFAAWCDRQDSPAQVRDHLELAERLAEKGRGAEARARAIRATEVNPSSSEAWAVLARAEREAGNREAAGKAFLLAADQTDPRSGANFCIEASLCFEKDSLADAVAALARAVDLDPSSLVGHTSLARGAAAAGDDARTWRAADRSLELAGIGSMAEDTQREIALLGGRAAAQCEEWGASRRLYSAVLSVDPKNIEALEAIAHADFETGDFHTARVHLETRINLDQDDAQRGEHLAMLGRGLEADHLLDEAKQHYASALEIDPKHELAYEGLARIHEKGGHLEEAISVLEKWSEQGSDHTVRANAALRAAEHALSIDQQSRAQQNLETTTQLAPTMTRAWDLLSGVVAETGSASETLSVCEAALAAIAPSVEAAPIALRAAQLAEQNADAALAQKCFSNATQWDRFCVEGALGEARLIRATGDWRAADEALGRFLERHPNAEAENLALIHLERGRLLSGPLEDFEAAIDAYGRALTLQPDLNSARTAMAGLLVHSPDRWREALNLNRAVLETEPTNAASLRSIASLAKQRGSSDVAQAAQALLDALGHSSPHEANQGTGRIPFATHSSPPMSHADAERLRRIAHLLRDDAGHVLGEIEIPEFEVRDPEVAEVINEILRIEGELTAPGIGLLSSEERRDFFSAAAGLLLDLGGNGGHPRYREALDRALGRWSRRKLRRIVEETTLEAIEAHDHAGWGAEIRAMAAAALLDRGGRSLSVVLRAMLLLDRPTKDPGAYETGNLESIVLDTDSTTRLTTRLTALLCDRLIRGN